MQLSFRAQQQGRAPTHAFRDRLFSGKGKNVGSAGMSVWKRPQPPHLHESKATPPEEAGVRRGRRQARIPRAPNFLQSGQTLPHHWA